MFGGMVAPVRYHPLAVGYIVTSPFGPRDGGVHSGVDFGKAGGSGGLPVYAIQSGTVLYAGAASGYGGPDPAGWLVIDSDDSQGGGVFEYGHVIREVNVGDKVTAGQRIARINPDSASNGGVAPHLHVSHMPLGYAPGAKDDPFPLLRNATFPGNAAATAPKSTGTAASTGPLIPKPVTAVAMFTPDVVMLTSADDGERDPSTCQAIVVHTNQGPETGKVESLLAYMQDRSREVSYNLVVGADGRVGQSNQDRFIPWAAGQTANEKGLHVCALGYAEQTRTQWLDPEALLDGLARVFAFWSTAYGIPLKRITAAELRSGVRGVCGHFDTAQAWRETDHTDPGTAFPYDLVIAKAQKLIDATTPMEDDMFTDDDRKKLNYVFGQLQPWSQLGVNAKNQPLTLVDAVSGVIGKITTISGVLGKIAAKLGI